MSTENDYQIGDRVFLNSLRVYSEGTVVGVHLQPDSVLVVWDGVTRVVRVLRKNVRRGRCVRD